LISKGANIELKDNQQRTLLHWAVLNRCPRIVKEILAGNASIDPKDDEGRTPLHWAVLKKNISIAML
jgi:ankyrin repeat protein